MKDIGVWIWPGRFLPYADGISILLFTLFRLFWPNRLHHFSPSSSVVMTLISPVSPAAAACRQDHRYASYNPLYVQTSRIYFLLLRSSRKALAARAQVGISLCARSKLSGPLFPPSLWPPPQPIGLFLSFVSPIRWESRLARSVPGRRGSLFFSFPLLLADGRSWGHRICPWLRVRVVAYVRRHLTSPLHLLYPPSTIVIRPYERSGLLRPTSLQRFNTPRTK